MNKKVLCQYTLCMEKTSVTNIYMSIQIYINAFLISVGRSLLKLFYADLYLNSSIILAHHMRMIACYMSPCQELVDGASIAHSTAFLLMGHNL